MKMLPSKRLSANPKAALKLTLKKSTLRICLIVIIVSVKGKLNCPNNIILFDMSIFVTMPVYKDLASLDSWFKVVIHRLNIS